MIKLTNVATVFAVRTEIHSPTEFQKKNYQNSFWITTRDEEEILVDLANVGLKLGQACKATTEREE